MTADTEATTDAAPISFPHTRGCPYEPPAGYDAFKGKGALQKVVLYDNTISWLVTDHALARKLLGDTRLSSNRTHPGYPALSPAERTPLPFRMLPDMDPPEHDIQRRLLLPSFTLKRARQMRPQIEKTSNDLLDQLLRKQPPVDLVSEYAVQLPMKIICEFLGIPYQDHAFFEDRGYKLEKLESVESVQQMIGELCGYLDELITRIAANPDPEPGLLPDLVQGPLATGEMSRQDLVVLSLVMLNSGHVTTSQMIALGLFTLFQHPDQLAQLRADLNLMPSAVEELLRYLSIADLNTKRVAMADVEAIDGVVIAEGEAVIVPNALVNRDPGAFVNPDVFDIDRTDEARHLALGFGAHQCIGQHLAKVEVEVALTGLLTRIPTLALAVPASEVEPVTGGVEGIAALPVTW
jgi:cytochrome P450